MARRIVSTMLALIGALLVTTVVPLGLITTGHERHSFQQDTTLSARALAGVAEDRLADHGAGPALGRALAQAARAARTWRVYDAGRRLVAAAGRPGPAVSAAVLSAAPARADQHRHRRSMTGCGWSSR